MSSYKVSISSNVEHDCTIWCKSVDHGIKVTQALTKRAVTDEQLAAYLNWICANCSEVHDKEGRTALHLASSCGRSKLARYLINVHGATVNATDAESGCTALHRAVFYGQLHVAVDLMKLGAELGILDNGYFTAVDYAMRDRYPPCNLACNSEVGKSGEIYVWGSNENYTLGIGNQQSRNYPDLLDVFRKENLCIKQVSLHKFHTLFLTGSGQVYSCGHGQGGRLGNGAENTVLSPNLVHFSANGLAQESCIEVSAGRDHSLFVTESGIVWSCGLNTYSQLGHLDVPSSILTPRPLKSKLSSVRHVCATRFHSVAWGAKGVFTWGLNSGQLGHDKTAGQFISVPKKVMGLGNSEITAVASSDGAIVVTTSSGHIYVLHEFQCRKIGSKRPNIASVSVMGGHLNASSALSHVLKEKGGDYLRILVLTLDGLLYVWNESSLQLIRCIFSLKRQLSIKSVAMNLHNVYLVTEQGEAFKGEFKASKLKRESTSSEKVSTPFTNFLNRHECAMIKVTRIPNIYRAIAVACDGKGRNCAVIQVNPGIDVNNLPQISSSRMTEQMLELVQSASLDDLLHDIEFKVAHHIIPAHKFIVFKSDMIKQLYDTNSTTGPVEIQEVNPDIFKQLLKFMYTGSCDLLQVGICPIACSAPDDVNLSPIQSKRSSSPEYEDSEDISAFEAYRNQKSNSKADSSEKELWKRDPLRQLQHCAKRFGISELQLALDKFRYDNGVIKITTSAKKFNELPSKNTLSRSTHKYLWDASIRTISGTNSNIIKAHRCILVARLEYFYGMFMHEWRENNANNVITLPYPHRIVEVIIDFLYTDRWSEMDTCDDIDFICQLMIVADQLFIVRLREMCEVVLARHITLKNVATFIQFASVYNANQLSECCARYICLNLAPLLENRSLDILPDELLRELTDKYMCYNIHMSTRVITPYSTAPTDEEILEIHSKYSVNMDDISDVHKKKQGVKKKILPRKTSESEKRRSRSESVSDNKTCLVDDSIVCNQNEAPQKLEEKLNKVEESLNNGDEKQLHIVQLRLKAVALGQTEDIKDCFQKLTPDLPRILDFPELGSRSTEPKHEQASPVKDQSDNAEVSTKKSSYAKISQKQRKKLLAQSIADELEKVNMKLEPEIPVSPWGMKVTGCDSFANILKNEQKHGIENDNRIDMKSPTGSPKAVLSRMNDLNFIDSCSSPENASSGFIKNENVVFSQIIADERQQRENYSRMKSKPLILTQIEDRAIEDLEKFYNIDEVDDELITVARVCKGKYASPLWIQKQN